MNDATRNVDTVARLQDTRRLALDGEGDFALLQHRPLIARVTMKVVASAWGNAGRLHAHDAGRVAFERRRLIGNVLVLQPLCNGPGRRKGRHENADSQPVAHEFLPIVFWTVGPDDR